MRSSLIRASLSIADNRSIDRSLAIRAALIQVAAVFAVALVLGLLLPRSFFEDWGWLSGPIAWLACAYATARILALPASRAIAAAILAGLPSVLAVLAGLHWLGALLAAVLFGLLCGSIVTREPGPRAA